MNIVFVSNYYNHHQSALSEEFFRQTGGNYVFIATSRMSLERAKLGYSIVKPHFLIESYKDNETYNRCIKLINEADVVIFGSAPEKMIRKRIRSGKLVFRYSERIYKSKKKLLQLPFRFIKYHWDNYPYKNLYMLCATTNNLIEANSNKMVSLILTVLFVGLVESTGVRVKLGMRMLFWIIIINSQFNKVSKNNIVLKNVIINNKRF